MSSRTIFRALCVCYYIYCIFFEILGYKREDFFNRSINNIGDFLLLITSLILILTYNFNRYYFGFKMQLWFTKLLKIRKVLFNFGTEDRKYTALFVYFFVIITYVGTTLLIVFECISFNLGKNTVGVITLTAYGLPIICLSFNCSCFIILFYIIASFLNFSNNCVYKYSINLKQYRLLSKSEMNKFTKCVKHLIQIQNDLCETRNMFLYMTGVTNLAILLSILIFMDFYIYFIVENWELNSAQENFERCSLSLFSIFVQYILFTIVYVVQDSSYEVNI